MQNLRGRLAAVGLSAAVGLLLSGMGLATDRATMLLLGLLLLAVAAVLLAPIVPRGFRHLPIVVRLAWAMLRRIEHGAPVAPESILAARRLDVGGLALRLRFPVTTASRAKREAWLRMALQVGPDQSFDIYEESARIFVVTVGDLDA